MSGALRILVQRDGSTVKDFTICQKDEVKSDGWHMVDNRELVYAEQVTCAGNPLAGMGLSANTGDWIVIRGHGEFPEVYADSEFRSLYKQVGIYDGKPLFQLQSYHLALSWQGKETIRLYAGDTPAGSFQEVRQGDWIVRLEPSGYRCVRKALGDMYFRRHG
jgi:hypothetical protein